MIESTDLFRLVHFLDVLAARPVSMIAGFLMTFGVRGFAIKSGWSLPVFRQSLARERWKLNRKQSK